MGVSVYWPLSVLYVFVCVGVCVSKSEYQQKTASCVRPQCQNTHQGPMARHVYINDIMK